MSLRCHKQSTEALLIWYFQSLVSVLTYQTNNDNLDKMA